MSAGAPGQGGAAGGPVPCPSGQAVRWHSAMSGAGGDGVGRFVACWLSEGEAVWDVALEAGQTVHLFPSMGDTMVALEAAA